MAVVLRCSPLPALPKTDAIRGRDEMPSHATSSSSLQVGKPRPPCRQQRPPALLKQASINLKWRAQVSLQAFRGSAGIFCFNVKL